MQFALRSTAGRATHENTSHLVLPWHAALHSANVALGNRKRRPLVIGFFDTKGHFLPLKLGGGGGGGGKGRSDECGELLLPR
jgi:hypothetical protein